VLLYGDLPHKAALRAIAESDAMLRTTLYDGDSVSVREALAAGTPVIATDNGMRPEGVRLIPAQDMEALLAAVGEELARHDRHVGPEGARQAAEENLRAVVELYRKLAMRGDGS
jgi:glycogen(starch) synthase